MRSAHTRPMSPHPSRTILAFAVGCALFLGFIMPHPQFVDSLMGYEDSYIPPPASTFGNKSELACPDHPLVEVNFYGETLCPDCEHMVVDVLDPIFKNGVASLMKLRYVAYGNVRGSPGGSISCQHGPPECLYNRHVNVVQKRLNYDQDKWFPVIKCLAVNMGSLKKMAGTCEEAAGLKAADIAAAAEGAEGLELETSAGKETLSLQPKHSFVPWVTVNGVALGGAFEDLERYVCAASPPARRQVKITKPFLSEKIK